MTAPWLRRAARRALFVFLCVLCLGSAIWGAFALWFQLPSPDGLRMAASGLFAFLGALALAGLGSRRFRLFGLAYAIAFAGIVIWFARISPSNDRDFAPEVAHGVTGVTRGDDLILKNVRNFSWTSPTAFNEVWEERRYDLSKLESADFYLVYFMGPLIAHSMVSFSFSDGRHLMFSIEIRRERHEEFSAIAGFFKRHELVFLAADERDYLFLRKANREDVRLYRLRISKDAARALLLQYVREANELAVHPQFYNTLTANCTTTIFLMLRALSPSFPLDWRVLLNGFLPSFAYEHNLVDTSIPLSELIARAAVTDRIKMGLSEMAFGARLREGLPRPE
ncbi:DUF4105 domain-containing protein [Methylocapsa palsarum]|uniref:Lnb N-terminal periplasmic domain-containing protein n=1 Tax=Methylocapsa palsarum TaxID=1612308 RepID=A0A1I3ZPS5_9HYPH|nr:DUF4105 domain-containing protein [Methylocapsa palsarum]SFK46018.1 protein of unknown function [Methylocapsa palsarum]